MTVEQLTGFFGWCSLINIIVIVVAAFGLMLTRDWVLKIHAGMFGVDEAELPSIYFKYLAYYKIAFFVFNLVPYLALRIIQ
ncbi:MAG: DUF6868 family protein [Geminicoccaceae bacterium]